MPVSMSLYPDIIDQLSANAYQQGIRYDLAPFQAVLSRLGNPEQSLKNIIHLAGTNGKGSTLTFIASALQACGFFVGTYTSPHFESYTERISLNGVPISQADFCRDFQRVREADLGCTLTEFELLTAMSFLYFKDKTPDFIIYETGLGGRLDATNVITPILSIITQIGLDHQAILGKTMTEIAREKAGIIKPNISVLVLKQSKKIGEVFSKVAKEMNAPLVSVAPLNEIPDGYRMRAPYQRANLALAQAALNFLQIRHTEQGLREAQIWGRYLNTKQGNQTVVIDAAHNPQGVRELVKALAQDYPGEVPVFVIGIYKTKKAKAMMSAFQAYSPSCFYCDFEPGRSFSFDEIKGGSPTIQSYSKVDIPLLPEAPLVVLAGSIYFISLFKPFFDQRDSF